MISKWKKKVVCLFLLVATTKLFLLSWNQIVNSSETQQQIHLKQQEQNAYITQLRIDPAPHPLGKRSALHELLEYDAEQSMRARAKNVMKRCENANVSQHDSKEKERAIFIISGGGNRTFLYKPIPKIGWTTWIYLLFEHGGLLNKVGKTIGRTRWQWGWGTPYDKVGFDRLEGETSFSNVTRYEERFIIIRNPWDRLVSGYKNKALELDFTYMFKRPCGWLKRNMPRLTFRQFVTCILDRAKEPGKALSSSDAAIQLNEHWMPLYTISTPCAANYTLIADFDHFNNDTTAALKVLNLKATLTHRNPTKKSNKTLSDWYNELEPSMVDDLRELYKKDFTIFGYDSTPPNFNNNGTILHQPHNKTD